MVHCLFHCQLTFVQILACRRRMTHRDGRVSAAKEETFPIFNFNIIRTRKPAMDSPALPCAGTQPQPAILVPFRKMTPMASESKAVARGRCQPLPKKSVLPSSSASPKSPSSSRAG